MLEGRTGEETRASILRAAPLGGDSSRSRSEESLSLIGITLDRICRRIVQYTSVLESHSEQRVWKTVVLTGVAWLLIREERRRGVAIESALDCNRDFDCIEQ